MPDPIKILLADDEDLVRRSMQKTLLRAGFEVETAASCPEAWALFESAQESAAPFGFAILDINMPGLQPGDTSGAGLELLSRLMARSPELPVVMLSAYDDVGRARQAVASGAQGYLVKGREQGLVELVNQILQRTG
jgi:two-component system response regulator FlrC